MMHIGESAVIAADSSYAYGDEGLPGKVGPKERILLTVKLLDASMGSIAKEV